MGKMKVSVVKCSQSMYPIWKNRLRTLNFVIWFSIVWTCVLLLLLPQVGGNLLQLSSRTTSAPGRKLAAIRTLLPLFPKTSSRRRTHTAENPQAMHQLYLDFMVAYSVQNRWDSVQLLIPRVGKHLCVIFQVFLLKNASISSHCLMSDTIGNISMSEAPSLLGVPRNSQTAGVPWSRDPLIICHFLVSLEKPIRRLNVNPKFFISDGYSPLVNILVLSSAHDNAEQVIDEIQPEINANYKWTLASRSNDSGMEIEDIYGIVNSGIPLRNGVGYWSYGSGLSFNYHKLQGPADFQGRTLRVTTVEGPPVVYVDKLKAGLRGRGYLPDILEVVSAELNFTYVLSLPPDNSFGSMSDNGTWSGMVGVLQRKEAEMALMSFSYTEGRRKVMDFSPPVEYSSTRILIRKDWHNNELKWSAYSDPFAWQVWFAIPWTICFGVLAFIVFSHFKLAKTTPSQSAWFLSACFLQQGLEEHSAVRRFPCRLALGSFWILAVVLYASYTARLTSFLAASTETMPVNSLAEAVANRNWKIGLAKGSSVPDRVRDSTLPEMMKMWSRIQHDSSGYVSGFMEGLSRVYTERFVFFTSDLIPSFLVKGNCSYTWVPGKYFSGFGYMGYTKNLPFKASISYQVAKIRETGQMKRIFKKWWGAESSCSAASSSSDFVGMSLYETGTAFLLLFVGATSAFIIMVVELYTHFRRPPDGNNTSTSLEVPTSPSASTTNSETMPKQNMTGDTGNRFMSPNNTHGKSGVQYLEKHIKSFFVRLSSPFTHTARTKVSEKPFSLNF